MESAQTYDSLYERFVKGEEKLALIGLGYVGMPIAVEFAKHVKVIGFNHNEKRIQQYKSGIDPTHEVGDEAIQASTVDFTSDEANLKACAAGKEAAGQAYNIAYGGREYLLDIYYGLTKALGVDVEPNFGPDRAGDIKHSNADISKARELLGYDPEWSFDRGIKAAIEWYKENL